MHIITRGRLLEFIKLHANAEAGLEHWYRMVKVNWPLVAEVVSVPHTQEEYERAVAMLDELIDEVGEAEDHPLASLMETLGSLIEAYEDDHLPEPLGDPLVTLRILMEEHNVGINDLS